ncbi:hypothetical protein TNCV_1878721 [Trichonephila clavipes]|nr:hypothetical protein TNCV_1878721 [Trichonephila clavipes]
MDDGSSHSYVEKGLVEEFELYLLVWKRFHKDFLGEEFLQLLSMGDILIPDKSLLADLASQGMELTGIGKDTPPIRVLLGADTLGSILTGRIAVFLFSVSAVETSLGCTSLGLRKSMWLIRSR